MKNISSKVTSKGQIVIPKRFREKYRIIPSTVIQWIEKEDGILIVPASEDPIISARGMLEGSGILDAYLQEKKLEKQKENKRIARVK